MEFNNGVKSFRDSLAFVFVSTILLISMELEGSKNKEQISALVEVLLNIYYYCPNVCDEILILKMLIVSFITFRNISKDFIDSKIPELNVAVSQSLGRWHKSLLEALLPLNLL